MATPHPKTRSAKMARITCAGEQADFMYGYARSKASKVVGGLDYDRREELVQDAVARVTARARGKRTDNWRQYLSKCIYNALRQSARASTSFGSTRKQGNVDLSDRKFRVGAAANRATGARDTERVPVASYDDAGNLIANSCRMAVVDRDCAVACGADIAAEAYASCNWIDDSEESQLLLEQAFKRLPKRLRKTARLFADGLKPGAVAKALKCTDRTVRNRRIEIRTLLADWLGQQHRDCEPESQVESGECDLRDVSRAQLRWGDNWASCWVEPEFTLVQEGERGFHADVATLGDLDVDLGGLPESPEQARASCLIVRALLLRLAESHAAGAGAVKCSGDVAITDHSVVDAVHAAIDAGVEARQSRLQVADAGDIGSVTREDNTLAPTAIAGRRLDAIAKVLAG